MSYVSSNHSRWSGVRVRRFNRSLGRIVSARKVNSKMTNVHRWQPRKIKSDQFSCPNSSTTYISKTSDMSKTIMDDLPNLSNVQSSSTVRSRRMKGRSNRINIDNSEWLHNNNSSLNHSTIQKLENSRWVKFIGLVLLITALALAITALVLQLTKNQNISNPATNSSNSIKNCLLLTFDDITNATLVFIENGYGGLNWQNAAVFNTGTTSMYSVALISGSYNAFNYGDRDMTIDANVTNTFSFYSFYATSPHNESSLLAMTGSRSRNILYSTTVRLDKHHAKYFELNWLNIDRLRFDAIVSIGFDNMCIGLD